MKTLQIIIYAIIIALLIITVVAMPHAFRFENLDLAHLVTILGLLFFVSLIVERFMDVVLTVTRAPASEKLYNEIQDLKEG